MQLNFSGGAKFKEIRFSSCNQYNLALHVCVASKVALDMTELFFWDMYQACDAWYLIQSHRFSVSKRTMYTFQYNHTG